jgi:hypothetical protein
MRASVCASRSRCSAASGLRAFDVEGAAFLVVTQALVEAVQPGALAHQVDDLVLENGGQPRAQRRPARERRTAGDHRLEHVVHQVLGQRRVEQAAPREAHQGLAVRNHLGPVHGEARRGGGRGEGGGGAHGVLPWGLSMA